jgi:hypothetical protein
MVLFWGSFCAVFQFLMAQCVVMSSVFFFSRCIFLVCINIAGVYSIYIRQPFVYVRLLLIPKSLSLSLSFFLSPHSMEVCGMMYGSCCKEGNNKWTMIVGCSFLHISIQCAWPDAMFCLSMQSLSFSATPFHLGFNQSLHPIDERSSDLRWP